MALPKEKFMVHTTPSKPLRVFSWSYWIILTVSLCFLVSHLIRQSKKLHSASITPTSPLDNRFSFSVTEAHETLRSMGQKGREIYSEYNKVDFILSPIWVREFLVNTFPPSTPQRQIIRDIAANVYAMGDLMENICIAVMLRMYPRAILSVAWIGCSGNVMKQVGLVSAVLTVLFEAYMRFYAP